MVIFGEAIALEKKADYEKWIKEFGAKPLTKELIEVFKEKHKFLEFGFYFAHRGFDEYLKAYKRGIEVAVVSGRGPSNYMHIGHFLIFGFVKWLQDTLNAEVYIPLSDDEKYVFGKVKDLNEAYMYAIDNALDIAALGYDPNKTHMYISSQTDWVYRLSLKLSRYLTYSTVRATFGLTNSTNPGVPFYAAVQAAHILMPTIMYNKPVVVPIAMDQDPHMRLSRDIAGKIKIFKPASIYSKYLRGLTGEPMSASNPETCIFTIDSPEIVRRKVWNALTGGRATVKEQRELGGEPDKCVVYEWLIMHHFKNLKEALEHKYKCTSGELLCGECKRKLIETIINLLKEHNEKKIKLIDKLQEFFDHKIDTSIIDKNIRPIYPSNSM